jgi:hypothetical protein
MYDDVFAPCKNPGLLLGSGVWDPIAFFSWWEEQEKGRRDDICQCNSIKTVD